MQLVEKVHYESVAVSAGMFATISGERCYCAFVSNDRAMLLRRTDPDVSFDDLRRQGEQLARCEQASRRRKIDNRQRKTV